MEDQQGLPPSFAGRAARGFQIATAQSAVLEAKAEQIAANAEVRINKIDLQILRLKQQEAKATAKERSKPKSQLAV